MNAAPPRPAAPRLDDPQTRAIATGVAAAALTLPLALYAHSSAPDPVHTPLIAADGRGYYLLALLAVAVMGALAQQLAGRDASRTAWILPALVALGVLLLAGAYHRWPVALIAPLLAGSGVFVAQTARALRADGAIAERRSAEFATELLTNATGLLVFAMLYLRHSPTRYVAGAVLVVGALLLVDRTEGEAAGLRRRALYGLIVGLTLAETTWALDYFPIGGWAGGAALQAIWYGMAAAIVGRLRGTLERASLLRHAGAAAVVFAASLLLAG